MAFDHNLPAYATWEQAVEGAKAVVAHFPGGSDPIVKECAKGALTVLDFGLSMIPDPVAPVPGAAKAAPGDLEELKGLLETHFVSGKKAAAGKVPWAKLIALLIQLLSGL